MWKRGLQRTLRMTWKTFQSTVLLRQGEADGSLTLRLLSVVSVSWNSSTLHFIKSLRPAAASHLRDWKEKRDHWQNLMDEMEGISTEALVFHEQLAETARQTKDTARDLHASKQSRVGRCPSCATTQG